MFFNTVVMGRDIQVTLPAEIRPALTGLPRAAAVFTGRDQHVDALLEGLRPAGGGGPTPVLAVAGMAGVGKTELVVQTAHRALRKPGWFPGGVLFVDMFGYDPDRRLSAADALLSWLQAIGIPGEHIPAGEQERARLWRSVLDAYTGQDRRLLLIVDNVASEDQVLPLLPSDPASAVLVTSRHTLDIDARLHDVPVLSAEVAVALIREVIAHRRGPEDPRLHASEQQQATTELATLCAGLPLAVRVVAALLADRPNLEPTALAALLRDDHTRLDKLSRQQVASRAVFDLSYQHLTDSQALLYRLLPVNPGPDIATSSIAALVDLAEGEVVVLLGDLHRAHLVEEPAVDRWRLHDLVRLHAASQPPATLDETRTARRRLFTHYLRTTRAADTHLTDSGLADTNRFTSRQDALEWLDDEHGNLISVCTSAATHDLPSVTVDLAFVLANFLGLRRHFADWLTVSAAARDICHQLGYRREESVAWHHLGSALRQVRRFEDAVVAFTRSREICCRIGDRHGEGGAWNSLGIALTGVGRFDEAITAYTTAGEIFRQLGDRRAEGKAWNNLGCALTDLGQFDEAITAHVRDLEICRQFEDHHGEGQAWNNIGLALRHTGRFEEAIMAHTRDLAICQQVGDHHGQGVAWNNLGVALRQAGRSDEALAAHSVAREIFHELGDRYREGSAWYRVGLVLCQERRFDEAWTCGEHALAVFTETGAAESAAEVLAFLDELGS